MLTFMLLFATALTANEQAGARDRIAKDTPSLVQVAPLTFEARAITVKGTASNPNAIANFVENVKNDAMFTMPDVKNVVKSGETYEFEFTTTVKTLDCHD
jgi:Tfp pilus assembly protein PilN